MKKTLISFFCLGLLFASISAVDFNKSNKAGAVDDYYSSINPSMKGDTLKEALRKIVTKNHEPYGYGTLEIAMKYTDRNWELSPDKNDENPYMVLFYADYNDAEH